MEPIRMKLQNSEPIRLCSECKHCFENEYSNHDCRIAVSVITGCAPDCCDVRSNPALCGLNGTYWESKQTAARSCPKCAAHWEVKE